MLDLERAYVKWGPMVLRRCRKLLRDEGLALDAMQDVFVELLRRREHLDEGSSSGLFLTVATNVCLNRLRTVRRHPEDRDDGLMMQLAAATPDHDERTSARRLLERIFAREVPSTLTIAVLFYVDRMTLEEVADEVGLSVSGVRKRLRTLRERLPVAEGMAS